MALRPFLNLLAVASAGMASPLAARNDSANSQSIEWAECEFVGAVDIECGNLDVPLDYTDTDAGDLTLSLSRVSAPNGPSKGSILVNFGGPGAEGVQNLASLAPLLLNMTGGHHDLVAFDPRGTGDTLPLSCFETQEERDPWQADAGLLSDATDVAPGDLWASAGVIANACNETLENGDLVGTAFVARDMMQIVDALDEDGLLRYWGISYGSALGATVAGMFPDRMDRVLLDGIANTPQYYHGFHVDADQQAGADAAWLAFLEECIAAGDKCGISHLNDTATDLADTLRNAAEQYRTDPITTGSSVISYSVLKTFYYVIIKDLEDPLVTTTYLNALIARDNITAIEENADALQLSVETGSENLLAIACADAIPRADAIADVMPEVEHLEGLSREFGAIMGSVSMTCARWPFAAKERRPVDEPVKTRNPVLFVGNTYDVATAIDSAYKMSELFPGSVVVEQKGFGHASVSQKSECTWKAISDYFIDGVLPDGNIECEVDVSLFP